MQKIRIAIVGVGNCCSALVQGLHYYKNASSTTPGLMHARIGDYGVDDIVPHIAFDVDRRKVGLDLSQAIFAQPNCTEVFCRQIPHLNAPVFMGPPLDGVAQHMSASGAEMSFQLAAAEEPCDVTSELKQRQVDVVVNYLPVGSRKATDFYAQCALDAGCAFVNAIPEFIASDPTWVTKFEAAGLPCLGDDIKSQYGATFSHRQLIQGFVDRGIQITSTSQENYAGNTDFLNMSDPVRIRSKLESKTSSLVTLIPYEIPPPYAGPGVKGDSRHGFRPERKDRKLAIIKVNGQGFGNIPITAELRIECEDSPNSAGVIIDAIRCAKVALDRGIRGAVTSPSSFFFKHPLENCPDSEALKRTEEFIAGARER